jgi:hypothetical protein
VWGDKICDLMFETFVDVDFDVMCSDISFNHAEKKNKRRKFTQRTT